MTLGQIKSFITVANEHSFAKAANILFISQPAISKSVAKLEAELGLILLDRRSVDVHLTPAGKKLYDFFINTQNNFRDVIGEIHSTMDASSENIRLGCPDTWDPNHFYDKIMQHFKDNLPTISIEIESYRLTDLFDMLKSGDIDMILTYDLHRPLQYGFTVRHLIDISNRVVYSKRHFKNINSLEDLKDAVFLVFDVDVEKKFIQVIKKVCSAYGFVPEVINYNYYGSALFNMSCGRGVMLFTEWDSVNINDSYGSTPMPMRVPVNIVYKEDIDKPGVPLVAKELEKLFFDINKFN